MLQLKIAKLIFANILFAPDHSSQLPFGLTPTEVPQFVLIGTDDQNISP